MLSLLLLHGLHLLGLLVPVVAHLAGRGSAQDCVPSPVGISPNVPLEFSLCLGYELPALGFLLSWVGRWTINAVVLSIRHWD